MFIFKVMTMTEKSFQNSREVQQNVSEEVSFHNP